MDNKHLLPREEIITESNGSIVTLTNYRLRYTDKQFGKAHIVSLLLENISSIEVHYRSKTLFAIVAGISIIAGILAGLNGDGEFVVVGLGVGILAMVLFFFSRKHFLTISSTGGSKIHFHTKGMKRDIVLDFINQVENAAKLRKEELNQK